MVLTSPVVKLLESVRTQSTPFKHVKTTPPRNSTLRTRKMLARPWDVMYQGSKGTSSAGNWVSRRMVVSRWTISLRKEDLEPVEDFSKAVEDALKEPTAVRQMQALRGVFAA
ncbi:hypothetical protein FRC11_015003, partial [Ceratobasidium sp. 423]